MIVTIPTSTTLSSYTQRVILTGREYIFAFQWNQRAAKWTLSLYDENGDAIVEGLWVVANYPLNRLVVDDRAPAGILVALDLSGSDIDPGLYDLGDRVKLVFVSA